MDLGRIATLYVIEYDNNNIDDFQRLIIDIVRDGSNCIYYDGEKYSCFILSTDELGDFEKKLIYFNSFNDYAIFHCKASGVIVNIEN